MGLDGVALVIAFEDAFGIAISDAEAVSMETPRHVVDFVCQRLTLTRSVGGCVSQKAFYDIRRELVAVTGLDRDAIRLDTRILEVFPKPERQERWRCFREASGIPELPSLTFGRGSLFQPIVVRDIVNRAAATRIRDRSKDRKWTRGEVRETVRQIIQDELGVQDFSDGDHFVYDLGVS